VGTYLFRYPWSAISDLAWYRNLRYRTEESGVGYWNKLLSDFGYSHGYRWASKLYGTVRRSFLKSVVEGSNQAAPIKKKFNIGYRNELWCQYLSGPFRYRCDSFQSDIFFSDIGITDVDVGCWISPTLIDVDACLCVLQTCTGPIHCYFVWVLLTRYQFLPSCVTYILWLTATYIHEYVVAYT
jgi:hypothetical protein